MADSVLGTWLLAVGLSLVELFLPEFGALALGAVAATRAETPKPAADIELVFGGDVMLARNLRPYSGYDPRPLDYAGLFRDIAPHIQQADLAFCNLEGPISGRGTRLGKIYAFNAPPEAGNALSDAGFDVVSLANNHSLDFGSDALTDTLANLSGRGIHYVGLSTDRAPQTPIILERKGLRIAYLAYQTLQIAPPEFQEFATRPADGHKDAILADIAGVRERADIVVVSLHWGPEHVPNRDAQQADLAHAIIDAGAHIVAGHHPHVQQEPEVYKGRLILYSMGNLVFATYSRPPARKTRLYRVRVNVDGIRHVEYLPLFIAEGTGRPEPLPGGSWTGLSVQAPPLAISCSK